MSRNRGGGEAGQPSGDERRSRGRGAGAEPNETAAAGEGPRQPRADEPEGSGGSRTPPPAGSDETDSVRFDEAFIRASGVTEPAARTRELAARWRREGYPEREPWRSDEPPAGWFWSRARHGRPGRGGGRLRDLRPPWRRKPKD
jgi:hypothetical protein